MLKTEANERSIEAIESKLNIVGGDMLKIEYLENSLKKDLPLEVRKYIHIKLADLYTRKLMFGEAAKKIEGAAEISQKFKERKELYMKQVQLLIKILEFDAAEKAFGKALSSSATTQEKDELKKQIQEIYHEKAVALEKIQNYKKASSVYEKLLTLQPGNPEIKSKLLALYNRVGKIKEAIAMEKSIKNPQPLGAQPEPKKSRDFDIDEFLNS